MKSRLLSEGPLRGDLQKCRYLVAGYHPNSVLERRDLAGVFRDVELIRRALAYSEGLSEQCVFEGAVPVSTFLAPGNCRYNSRPIEHQRESDPLERPQHTRFQ